MNKKDLLSAIKELSQKGVISKNEVLRAFEEGKSLENHRSGFTLGISSVLYLIGALIVFVGIAVLIGQNWDSLNPLTRILATLGFACVSYCLGIILNQEEKYGAAGYAFHLIAGLSFPIGLAVVFDLFKLNINDQGIQSFIAWVLLLFYLGAFLIYRKTIFTLFTIVYATLFFVCFTNYLIGANPLFLENKFYEYRYLVIGLSYGLLGYYLKSTAQYSLTESLYSFGTIFALGAMLALGGWKPEQNYIWEILYPGCVFCVLFLSTHLKSKPMLILGTIFLMLYILKITGEYFSGTLGWPLSLMICGIALIGIGYFAFSLNKKYLSE